MTVRSVVVLLQKWDAYSQDTNDGGMGGAGKLLVKRGQALVGDEIIIMGLVRRTYQLATDPGHRLTGASCFIDYLAATNWFLVVFGRGASGRSACICSWHHQSHGLYSPCSLATSSANACSMDGLGDAVCFVPALPEPKAG